MEKVPEALGEKGTACDKVGGILGVSGKYVWQAKQLQERDSKLLREVFEGRLTIAAARQKSTVARRRRDVSAVRPFASSDCSLILGDAPDKLAEVKGGSIRCIFTDPPYNLGKKYHGDDTGDAREESEFLGWCARWLEECRRVLTPDGSIFVMMSGRYAPGIHAAMKALGLHWRNTIYWWENNPENQTGNFSDAVRPIHYFTRSKRDYVVNSGGRSDARGQALGDKRAIDAGKLPDNVWIESRIPGNSIDRVPFEDAPPQLPVSIPQTCIRVASEPGDTVLDPFNGNGTTAIAALMEGRRYVGIDQSKKYLDQSRRWIASQLAAVNTERKSA